MSAFTPTHLGKWEPLFRDLMQGETFPLTPEGTWMIGDKPGLIAIFDDGETVYIAAAPNIGRTLQLLIKGGAPVDFRTLVAVLDLGASEKTAEQKAQSGPLGTRVDKRMSKMRYRVAPAPAPTLEALAEAFTVVADPRYNGPTARANRAIDALPQ